MSGPVDLALSRLRLRWSALDPHEQRIFFGAIVLALTEADKLDHGHLGDLVARIDADGLDGGPRAASDDPLARQVGADGRVVAVRARMVTQEEALAVECPRCGAAPSCLCFSRKAKFPGPNQGIHPERKNAYREQVERQEEAARVQGGTQVSVPPGPRAASDDPLARQVEVLEGALAAANKRIKSLEESARRLLESTDPHGTCDKCDGTGFYPPGSVSCRECGGSGVKKSS